MSNSTNQPTPDDNEHWEIYVTYVDDNPAVILVDLGISDSVPLAELPKLAWLWIHIQTRDEDGFPSEDEDFKLNEIEDAVTDAVAELNLRYVGRITTDGRREFYFYTDDFEKFQSVATAAMESAPDYQFEIDEADDPEWMHYETVLYPSPEDFQQIKNQSVITQLMQEGDSLTKSRPVDHFADFKNEEDRETFVIAAAALGFEVVSRREVQEEKEFPYTVGLLRTHSVDPETVDQVTFELFELAGNHNGQYDGWGSAVVK